MAPIKPTTPEGECVRNLLADADAALPGDAQLSPCRTQPYPACAAAMTYMADKLGEYGAILRELARQNGRQDIDLAVLQNEARHTGRNWGLIAGGTVSIIVGIATHILLYYILQK